MRPAGLPPPPLSPRTWPSWAGVGLLWLVAQAPDMATRALGRLIGALAFRLARRRRRIAEANLALCFPDQVACLENIAGDREIPDHPLVQQTIYDALHEAMDVDGLERLLEAIEAGRIACFARDLTEPSPLSQEILNARPYAFLDDAPLEERRTQAVMMRRWLDPESASDIGALDGTLAAQIKRSAASRDFRGARDETAVFLGGDGVERALLVGLGKVTDRRAALRRGAAIAARRANSLGFGRLMISAGALTAEEAEAVALGAIAGAWELKEYQTPPPEDERRTPLAEVSIVGDAGPVMARLREVLPAHNARREPRADEVRGLRAESAAKHARLAPQLAWIEALRAELPENGIYVEELTQIGYVGRLAFPTYKPRTYISTGYQGTLGWGVAAAIGVKAARPNVPVLSVCGDGGFMFNVQELATAVHFRIPVVAIVFNDNAFGNVRRMQRDDYRGRTIASDLTHPDFVKMAESYGAMGLKATSPEELRGVLRRALKEPGPTLIEVPIGDTPAPWNFVQLPRVRPRKG